MNDNWEKISLGELCYLKAGGTPDRSEPLFYGGSIKWVKSGEVCGTDIYHTEESITTYALQNSSAKLLECHTVLLAMYGATAGQVARLKVSAATNQAVLAITPKQNNIDLNFLYYLLEKSKYGLLDLCQGSGQPNLSNSLVKNFIVKLPPLPEQKKIADILSTIDETIDKKSELKNKYKNLFFSFIQELIFKNEKIQLHPLRKLTYCFSGYPFSSNDFLEPGEGTFRIVRGDNLNEGFFEWGKKEKRWSSISRKLEMYSLKEGDLLIGMDGSKVGKNWSVVKKKDLPALLGQRVCCIRAKEKINQQFLSYLFGTIKFRKYVEIVKTGTSIPHISKKQIEDFSIPLPTLDEQKKIVKILSQIDSNIDSLSHEIRKLYNLKKAISSDLISCRKTVNI